MTPASLRIRLALALGLPLAPACKASPSTDPMIPGRTTPVTTTPVTTPPATTATPTEETPPTPEGASSACAPDHIHEHVCGLIDTSYEGGGGLASAPYEHCTLNALPLWDLETRHVRDGWRIGSHDAVLAEFTFDAPGTAEHEYTGTYHPEDPRCCYERCNPIGAIARPRLETSPGVKEHELCLPAPESTAFPAETAAQCPAGVRARQGANARNAVLPLSPAAMTLKLVLLYKELLEASVAHRAGSHAPPQAPAVAATAEAPPLHGEFGLDSETLPHGGDLAPPAAPPPVR